MINRLANFPNAYQTSLATKCHLPKNSNWPSRKRNQGGALSLKTLGEFSTALHVDFLHSKDKDRYPVPQVESMIRKRCEMQNAFASIQRCNEEIVEIDSVEELMCFNMVKHRVVRTHGEEILSIA